MHLDAIFYPKSIAVVGASRTVNSVGNDLVKNLVQQEYQGKIYPINPQADELYGLKVYHDLAELPDDIDLVVVAVPAKFVPAVMTEAAKKHAKGAIVISAGFKEVGHHELENELPKFAATMALL